MDIKDVPLTLQLKKENSIKVTPSFLLGLISHSMENKLGTDEKIEALKNKLNVSSARVLTGEDIFKLADEPTSPGIPSKLQQGPDTDPARPSNMPKEESSVWSTPSEAPELSLITDAVNLLDTAEYLIAEHSLQGLDAYEVVALLKSLARMVNDGDKVTPQLVEQMMLTLQPKEPTKTIPQLQHVTPGETEVMLRREDIPEEQWGKSPEEFLAGLKPPVQKDEEAKAV